MQNRVAEKKLKVLRTSSRSEDNVPIQERIKKWHGIKDLIGEYDDNYESFEQWENQMKKLLLFYNLNKHSAKVLIYS